MYAPMTREQLISNLATIEYITNQIRETIIHHVCQDKNHVGGAANPRYQLELRERVHVCDIDISEDVEWVATGLSYINGVCYIECETHNGYYDITGENDARFRLDTIEDYVPLAKILEQILDDEEHTNG